MPEVAVEKARPAARRRADRCRRTRQVAARRRLNVDVVVTEFANRTAQKAPVDPQFCARSLPHADEVVLDWVAGPAFDRLLTDTVKATYPEHEHEQFIAHLRGLTGLWVSDETTRLRA